MANVIDARVSHARPRRRSTDCIVAYSTLLHRRASLSRQRTGLAKLLQPRRYTVAYFWIDSAHLTDLVWLCLVFTECIHTTCMAFSPSPISMHRTLPSHAPSVIGGTFQSACSDTGRSHAGSIISETIINFSFINLSFVLVTVLT